MHRTTVVVSHLTVPLSCRLSSLTSAPSDTARWITLDSSSNNIPGWGLSPLLHSRAWYPLPSAARPLTVPVNQANVQQDEFPENFDPMLFQCWASVCDAGPTLKQHWVRASWDTPLSRRWSRAEGCMMKRSSVVTTLIQRQSCTWCSVQGNAYWPHFGSVVLHNYQVTNSPPPAWIVI